MTSSTDSADWGRCEEIRRELDALHASPPIPEAAILSAALLRELDQLEDRLALDMLDRQAHRTPASP